ncbi:hypothetical protein FALBO_16759, partial [Fusarium albosuccineum]
MLYYSEYHPDRAEHDINHNASARSPLHPDVDGMDSANSSSFRDMAPNQQPHIDLNELMEPAIDGPPSPERIRQLSKQMKHASHLNRGHRTASSGSSSLLNSERPGWEQALDNMSITRRSSQRSTTSGSPSRDRPDLLDLARRWKIFLPNTCTLSGRS